MNNNMFETVKNMLSKTAKDAVRVSGNAVEYTKLKLKLSQIKEELKESYAEIGKIVYQANLGENVDDSKLEGLYSKITDGLAQMKECEYELNNNFNKKVCDSCGESLSSESQFCPKCGNKVY